MSNIDLIEIVCGIDANYAPHLAVMLKSLSSSNPDQHFRVHVLNDGIGDALRARVNASCKNILIEWKEIDNSQVLAFKGFSHISRATYLRLVMAEVLEPAIKRVLYLDVDLVINQNIRALWDTELCGKICAAVTDPGIDPETFAKKYFLSMPGSYFNAGVMLIDMERLRAGQFLQKAIEVLANPDSKCELGDQDALNIVLWNKWLPVNLSWNFQRKFLYSDFAAWKTQTRLAHEPAIIHFTEAWKPWRGTEWHPYAWLYLKNLLRTSFRDEVMKAGGITPFYIFKKWLKYRLKGKSVYA